MKYSSATLLILSAIATLTLAAPSQPLVHLPKRATPALLSADDLNRVVSFLTTDINTGATGVAYTATSGQLKGKLLPLGFYTSNKYFGDFLCGENSCAVEDVFNPQTYEVFPRTDDPANQVQKTAAALQIERMNIVHGLNIYDGACWQIAMGLLATKGGRPELMKHTLTFDQMLHLGHTGDAMADPATGAPKLNEQRANKPLKGVTIPPENSFFWRYWPRKWLSEDPLMKGYDQLITATGLPEGNADYKRGVVSWADFKPITGENAWAIFMGPLQSAHLREIVVGGKKCVDFNSHAVQTAIKALPWVQRMQSMTGGVWYAPEFSLGNVGSETVPPFIVSVENNVSLLSGLVMLQKILGQIQTQACAYDATQMTGALKAINEILAGGPTPGMFSFFKNHAIDVANMKIHSGGHADRDGPGTFAAYTKEESADAVDVLTWGIAAMGVPYFDSITSFGMSHKMWVAMRDRSGFFVNGQFYGMGYSNTDGNGKQGNSNAGIISGEWTLGAINMCKVMIQQYTNMMPTLPADQQAQIPVMIAEIQADLDSMLLNVSKLRTDQYATAPEFAAHRPAGHDWKQLTGLQDTQLAFLYASKRYFIPFGWYSNPLPSTTSTAWALYMHYDYNPFALAGTMDAQIPAATVA